MIKNDTKLLSHLSYKTDNLLLTVNFSIDDIAKILQNLEPNKAHGHDKISILQLCGNLICKPLELILNSLWKVVLLRLNGKKKLISPHQFVFKPGDSCINQLLAITHKLYKSCGI